MSMTGWILKRTPVKDESEEVQVLEDILKASSVEQVRSIASRRLETIRSGQAAAPSGGKEKREHSARVEETLRALHAKKFQSEATTGEYWENAFSHGLKVYEDYNDTGPSFTSTLSVRDYEMLKETLDDNGFFASPSLDWGKDICFNEMIEAMKELKSKGWPACFIFAYQQPWHLIDKLFDFAEQILETDQIAIEPSVFAWHLDPPVGEPWRAGNNGFNLPHRDFTYDETFDEEGNLKVSPSKESDLSKLRLEQVQPV
ncbi:hypothetical protein GUITHDRAFT_107046 [Guillardia theta CCMP2712]|uniref:Uncharacterized protein n=1 Tax=Guillardia theta (strain CCMP2712) TaxID=905079 RepID=L1JGB1_GUITC|nr:hypothetical protein GUITHDRAFT_107046 [Guillardia theta CCMP2712]EKX47135.1 hypothetical protein GUITHDRAFT_107046 [Guillardia theta CCMP2712]|eukprot:XP_005834115.1 hypothetical protein GUITHDRAFT_107046 [Guillardia theta CCMP2712]